jgi:hypothetical protein
MLSNFKLGIYEFLGLVVPGVLLLLEGWIVLRGWDQFVHSLGEMHTIQFTVFVAVAFVLGHFVQELADWSLKKIRGPRFLKSGRDEFWAGPEADAIKNSIWTESGITLPNVDGAFDYCLTRLGQAFPKRDTFVATSDFARSFLVLCVFAVAPIARLAKDRAHSTTIFLVLFLGSLALLAVVARLAWLRMVRFRLLSEASVFRVYLGSRGIKDPSPPRE